MFKKTFTLRTESSVAMAMVKVLGKYGVRFEVSDEYVTRLGHGHTWYRDFIVRTNKRRMVRIWKDFRAIANR